MLCDVAWLKYVPILAATRGSKHPLLRGGAVKRGRPTGERCFRASSRAPFLKAVDRHLHILRQIRYIGAPACVGFFFGTRVT